VPSKQFDKVTLMLPLIYYAFVSTSIASTPIKSTRELSAL